MRFHLVLDVPVSRAFKAGVNVLDSVDARDEQEAAKMFAKSPWRKPGAYIMSDEEALSDPRGIFGV